MALFEVPISIISMVLPMILMTLRIAQAFISSKYQELLGRGLEKTALERTFRITSCGDGGPNHIGRLCLAGDGFRPPH